MIIEFSLGNYRSFQTVQTLSFRATGLVSENKHVDECNIEDISGQKLLKVVGLYGPNASGKSNLIKALLLFKEIIANSLEKEQILRHYRDFFAGSNTEERANGSMLQIVLLLNEKRYRYGFTITTDQVKQEWLFGPAEKNETYYFKRNSQEIEINKERFPEGSDLPFEKLRKDTLLLGFISSFDGPIAGLIRSFITEKIVVDEPTDFIFSGGLNLSTFTFKSLTNRLVDQGKKEIVLNWMKEAGIYYKDISIGKIELKGGPDFEYVQISKNIYNGKGEVIGEYPMIMTNDESAGTKKFYGYIGQFYKLFQEGGVFISDEIDNNFHPSLLRKIVRFFQQSDWNQSNAQLLFTSHDTNLMDHQIMRRDQFYFTEKNTVDSTRLYSLADLKGVRNNADFARQYLSGIYGALPVLGQWLEIDEEDMDSKFTDENMRK